MMEKETFLLGLIFLSLFAGLFSVWYYERKIKSIRNSLGRARKDLFETRRIFTDLKRVNDAHTAIAIDPEKKVNDCIALLQLLETCPQAYPRREYTTEAVKFHIEFTKNGPMAWIISLN